MVIPKEHGAWFMLFGPFIAGIAAAKSIDWRIALLFVAVISFFLAHAPIMIVLKLNRSQPASRAKIHQAYRDICIYLAAGCAATLALLLSRKLPLLIPIGVLALAFEGLGIHLVRQKLDRDLLARWAGICSLTASGPATYYVLTQRFDRMALLLWIVCVLYFASSVFYVKMRVELFSGKTTTANRKWLCAIYHVFLAMALGISAAFNWIPLLIAVGFVPVILRAFWAIASGQTSLNIKRLGFAEVAYATFFIVLLSIGV